MKWILYDPITQLHKFFLRSFVSQYPSSSILVESVEDGKKILSLSHPKEYTLILFLNPQFLKTHLSLSKQFFEISKKFPYKIYYITEPLQFSIEKKVWEQYLKILNPCEVWTYSYGNLGKINLHHSSVPFYIVPPFYSPSHIPFYDISWKDKRTDKIVFIGNPTNYRKDILEMWGENLIIIDNIWSLEDLEKIYSEYLYFLNLHRRNGIDMLETFRIIPILSNQCIVLSERSHPMDEKRYEEYNIYFDDRKKLFSLWMDKKGCDETIFDKTIKFRMENNQLKKN